MSKPQQQELPGLEADYGWFHVMRPLLMNGKAGELGATPWLVYCIIKAHTERYSGRAWPSQETIARLANLKTDDAVRSAVRKLEQAGLLKTQRRGRHTEYVFLESAPVTARATGDAMGSADWQYVPDDFKRQIDALKAFLATGIPPGRGITLNLNINIIHQGAHSTVNLQNISVAEADALREEETRKVLAEFTERLRLL